MLVLTSLIRTSPYVLRSSVTYAMPVVHGLGDRADVDLAAVLEHLAADEMAPRPPEDAHGELGAPGAHQPGDADDLALADVDADVVDDHPIRRRSDARPSSSGPRTRPRRSSASRGGKRWVMSRPTMPRMMRSSVTRSPSASSDSMTAPSRRIVIVSATDSTSLSLCEIRTQAMPWARNSRSSCSSFWESDSLSDDVGSSRISSVDVLGQRLGDLDELLLADAEAVDLGVGRLVEPDLLEQLDRLACATGPS